ncbi:uncharacterized protein TNCV_4024081 [Trichonephila clavipes]|nr:uncharacterized protein TNCV_4024081 [Trichonephila clavipes]
MRKESIKRRVSWFHLNVITDCTSQTGTPPIEKNAEALLIFSFEQKQRGERGFSVSNGWDRTEAIPKREKGDDSKSDAIFFLHHSCQNIIIRKLNKLLVVLCLRLILVSKVRPRGGLHSGAQRVNPEFRVGSNFRIILEQYLSGMENVAEFLENIDNLTYYKIPTQLACAYLKGHLTVQALDWFGVLGYRVVED